jgi:uncharacterized membrane protein SpoIIM required for sporulation
MLFVIGLFVGVVCMNLGKSLFLEKSGLFDESSLTQMKYMTVDGNYLLGYVFMERFTTIAFLILLSTTYIGIFALCGVVFWYGISAGCFLSALSIRYGIKGILLALVGIFPQYLLYIPALIVLIAWSEQLYRNLHTTASVTPGLESRPLLLRRILTLLIILGVVFVGCLLESYVNPFLVGRFLRVF